MLRSPQCDADGCRAMRAFLHTSALQHHTVTASMRLLRIGLTGGAASGKSTLGRGLAAAGFTVINCDVLWHAL